MERKKIEKDYSDKVKKIIKYDKAYFQDDNPIVSDKDYDQIKQEIEKHSFRSHLHSSNKKIHPKTDFYLVNTYGELNKFYKISYMVFMGGSLIDRGGQNPLEAAKLGCKIIHGPHVSNFKEIYAKLKTLGISKKFLDYNYGSKLIEMENIKIQRNFNNKKLINYGEKILNLTYSEIKKFI